MDGLFNTRNFIKNKDQDGRYLARESITMFLHDLQSTGKVQQKTINRNKNSFDRWTLFANYKRLNNYLDLISTETVREFVEWRRKEVDANDNDGLARDLVYFATFYFHITKNQTKNNPFYEVKKEIWSNSTGPKPLADLKDF